MRGEFDGVEGVKRECKRNKEAMVRRKETKKLENEEGKEAVNERVRR